jgi:pyrimidine operon attenuation protein/uracil phosphoribosyltransferase
MITTPTSADLEPGADLPDAEAALAALAEKMAAAVNHDAVFVGIYRGGAWLAERLAEMVPGQHPVGFIDVSFYRDDYGQRGLHARVEPTRLPCEVEGSHIVLVDDVLYTGRSVRAAVNELFDYGRPATIELAVLFDRGGRELPIEATYVGARLYVSRNLLLVLQRGDAGRFSLSLEPVEVLRHELAQQSGGNNEDLKGPQGA